MVAHSHEHKYASTTHLAERGMYAFRCRIAERITYLPVGTERGIKSCCSYMTMNDLRRLARENNVKMPRAVTKVALTSLLQQAGVLPMASSPKAVAPATPKAKVARKKPAAAPKKPKRTATPPKPKPSNNMDGWTYLTAGRDGSIYIKDDQIMKVFTARTKAAKEAKFTSAMKGSGVVPEVYSFQDMTLIMQKVNGVDLQSYMKGLRGAPAPSPVQNSLIETLRTLDEYGINPNDSNLQNFIVDESISKVWRIDLGDAKTDRNHTMLKNAFILASKIYKSFPLVIQWLEPYMDLPNQQWRSVFGY